MIDAVGGMGERRVGPGTVVVDWGEGKWAEQCVVRERKKNYRLFTVRKNCTKP